MALPPLDYRSPDPQPKIDWGDRYLRFVPIFAAAYAPFLVAWFIFSLILEEKGVRRDPVPYRILEGIVIYPAIPLLTHTPLGSDSLLVGAAINAAIWGFSAVGIWHLTHVVRCLLRRIFG